MHALSRPLAILAAIGISAAAAAALQDKGGQEEFGPYELVENWPQPPPDGADAVKTGNIYLLFTKVATPPQNELTGPQTSVWHFGWNTPDSRKYNEKFRAMGLEIAQMWDAADGKLVDMSSDTLPGLPTQEQILEMRAKGTQPTRQGGFGYLRGPDGAMIENAQAGTTERFNHVHMYHEHPRCAMQWYVEHLGARRPQGRGTAAAAPQPTGDCHTKTYA